MLRIGFLGTKYTTVDCIKTMVEDGQAPVGVVTLAEEVARKNRVAGYVDVTSFTKALGIPTYVVNRYDLGSIEQLDLFRELGLDILLVIGWERLVPPEILASLKMFACGMHGSPDGLPTGRGRSPLNWSLILGRDRFTTSLFIYNPEIDAGSVIGSVSFEISMWDDIETLHLKNRLAMNKLLREALPSLVEGQATAVPQDTSSTPTYFPKRTPEDGAIDWTRSAPEIYDFVRALTTPYPGAYSRYEGTRVWIWRGIPVMDQLCPPADPGDVLDVSSRGAFLVQTGDGMFLVQQYSGIDTAELRRGSPLSSADWTAQLREIAARYPPALLEDQKEVKAP